MIKKVKSFLDDNFLLENTIAEILYHEYAAKQPIIDYHNHLPPDEIASDKIFKNITNIWLDGDHYKWRAMRTIGVSEKFITGEAKDDKKFEKWAETVPFTVRNPLFHWTHLELRRYFDIHELLSPKTSKYIYEKSTALLQEKEYSTRNLLRKMQVETVCTTDDPIDDLRYHQKVRKEGMDIKMLPAFRPDKAILIEQDEFKDYILKLGDAANISINSFDDLLQALNNRMDFFHENAELIAVVFEGGKYIHVVPSNTCDNCQVWEVEMNFRNRFQR